MKFSKFNFITFFISIIICAGLTFASLIVAAAREEGTGGDGILERILEKLYYIFRFPTHTLFFQFMDGIMFFVGLIVNCLFYGFVIERAFALYKDKK
jgi:hypothetical protein